MTSDEEEVCHATDTDCRPGDDCLDADGQAGGEVHKFAVHSFINGVVPDTVTNDLSIDFAGRYTASQLIIELEQGTIHQYPGGGIAPPPSFILDLIPELAFDTFVAHGAPAADGGSGTPGTAGGAVNLGGSPSAEFGDTRIDQHWYAAPDTLPDDQTDFLIARITLSSDARGTWSYQASADGLFGVVEMQPIEEGRLRRSDRADYNGDGLTSGADLDLVLLEWGETEVPFGFDENTVPGGGPFDGLISQNELDGVLLHWGQGVPGSQVENWSRLPELVDPRDTGGEVTGLIGDFNGSGQVEQADWDLVSLNDGERPTRRRRAGSTICPRPDQLLRRGRSRARQLGRYAAAGQRRTGRARALLGRDAGLLGRDRGCAAGTSQLSFAASANKAGGCNPPALRSIQTLSQRPGVGALSAVLRDALFECFVLVPNGLGELLRRAAAFAARFQSILEFVEPPVSVGDLSLERLFVGEENLGELLGRGGVLQPADVDLLGRGDQTDGRLHPGVRALELPHRRVEHPVVRPEAVPDKIAVVVAAEPVDAENRRRIGRLLGNLQPLLSVVADVEGR